jgi:hypothetical protein
MKLGLAIAAAAGVAVLASSLSSCKGGSCHTDADCSGQLCASPDAPPSCGIPPRMGCASSNDCLAGEVCHSVEDPCSAWGFGSECNPPCGACGAGLRCNSEGACEPVPCDQGFTCAPYEVCTLPADAGPVYDHGHGCVAVTCQEDADCPASTSCVNGACQSGPGHCASPQLVP